jgi:hypothetical protein
MSESAALEQVATPRELLASAPLLAGAEHGTIDELAQHVRPVRVHAGELVIREGEDADRLYIVRTARGRSGSSAPAPPSASSRC